MYELLDKVLYADDTSNPAFHTIEQIRKQLKKDKTRIDFKEFGAGSQVSKSPQRIVRQIASSSATSPKYGRLLARLAAKFGGGTILELGTSLGIGTLYMAAGAPQSRIITLEGDPTVAKLAEHNFASAGFSDIEVVTGPFEKTLPEVLTSNTTLDMVYIDGDHRGQKLLGYFEQIKPFLTNESLVIADDIRWSKDMQQAWEKLKQDPFVRVTADLYFKGLIFPRTEQPKQDFRIRF